MPTPGINSWRGKRAHWEERNDSNIPDDAAVDYTSVVSRLPTENTVEEFKLRTFCESNEQHLDEVTLVTVLSRGGVKMLRLVDLDPFSDGGYRALNLLGREVGRVMQIRGAMGKRIVKCRPKTSVGKPVAIMCVSWCTVPAPLCHSGAF